MIYAMRIGAILTWERRCPAKDAIEFQKHLREVGIASLSPEMRSRFDAEYGRLSAEEQREEWDVIIERTAVAHFFPRRFEKIRNVSEKIQEQVWR